MVRTGLGGSIPGAPDDSGGSDDSGESGTTGGGSIPGAPDDPGGSGGDDGIDATDPRDAPSASPPDQGIDPDDPRDAPSASPPSPAPDPDPPSGGSSGGGGSGTTGGGSIPGAPDDTGSGGGSDSGIVDRVTSTVGSAVDNVADNVGTPDSDITDRLTTGGLLSESPGTADGVVPGTVGGVDVSEQRLQQEAAETRQARNERFENSEELTVAGSDLPDRVITGAAQTASAVANPAGLATSAETALEVGTSAPGAIADEGAGDVAQTAAAVGVEAGERTVDAAQQNPAEFAGGAAFGVAAGTAATRGLSLRRGGSSTPDADGGGLGDLSSAVDVETPGSGGRSFFGDTRGQASFGRLDRGDSDTIDGESVETTVERGDSTDTIDAETFVNDRVRGGGDLESELRTAADEADTLADRQLTPRQRAEDRVPPADEFASPAAQQREINRLADRFRQDAMSDLDNRVVPQGPSATTRGQFGLDFDAETSAVGTGVVETATASPGVRQTSAEASEFEGVDPTSLGFTPTAGTLTDNTATGGGETDTVDEFAPPDDTTTTGGGGATTTTSQQPAGTILTATTSIGTTTGADPTAAEALGAQTSALGDAATATATQVSLGQSAVTGLDTDGPSRGRPRTDREDEQPDDDPARVLFGTTSSEFGSGILSGAAAAEDVFGR
ncbi:hypothetical protein PM085_15655 [Halorubrum ezzemoulense]|uniref:Uncharacterized protein n=1 Tax=Halorubrum ezzemoulense TaxID=337243 RepID=A0ABT4Z6I9_HALEZ|nr:hypothetical protein [Halorubrum ezzemoulense]MDB2293692.1 hypothetical protein [Halorubrum ezzemoulense]